MGSLYMDKKISATPLGVFDGHICRNIGDDILSNLTIKNGQKMQKNEIPLGIYTKLQVLQYLLGFQGNDENIHAFLRAEKYILQSYACDILKEREQRKNGKWAYKHRVKYCLKARIDADKPVGVRYNENRGKAHYDNLQRCGSVWTCPVCAIQITEGRRKEVKKAFDVWRGRGGFVYMATFTNRHHFGDDLDELLNGQKLAFVKFWEKVKVKRMLKKLGLVGRITSTEVTFYWENGWHPHYHIILFFDHEINIQALQTFMALEWQIACQKVGLKSPSLANGVQVQDGTFADEYISKWGLDYEITKNHIKKGRGGSLTPFDLLRQSPDDPRCKRLFKQYADVFKGKQQLVWSKGLKKLLGVSDVSDEQLATETDKDSVQVRELAVEIFELLVKYKRRADYLSCVEYDYTHKTNTAYNLVMEIAKIEAVRLSDGMSERGSVTTTRGRGGGMRLRE